MDKEAGQKRSCMVCLHLYEKSRDGTQTGGGQGLGVGELLLNGKGVSFGVMEMFGN